jgi:glycosyltransferase involved in cell wall biosynthesis
MCYQREITRKNIEIFNFLPNRDMMFSGCSADLVERAAAPGKWVAIHNGADFEQFTSNSHVPDDAPLIFLGRVERIKGCHTAIEVARQTGRRLIIAGNISQLPEERLYYEAEIKPNIDGSQIIYVGEVDDRQKNEWLGKSKALLMPIEWDEPFGIVMIEAMACGTPVIGFKRGSVPEVVEEGVTGFIINDKKEMVEAVKKIGNIDRGSCRRIAEARFDIKHIAFQYLNLFAD